jgi:hypothetical protein
MEREDRITTSVAEVREVYGSCFREVETADGEKVWVTEGELLQSAIEILEANDIPIAENDLLRRVQIHDQQAVINAFKGWCEKRGIPFGAYRRNPRMYGITNDVDANIAYLTETAKRATGARKRVDFIGKNMPVKA